MDGIRCIFLSICWKPASSRGSGFVVYVMGISRPNAARGLEVEHLFEDADFFLVSSCISISLLWEFGHVPQPLPVKAGEWCRWFWDTYS